MIFAGGTIRIASLAIMYFIFLILRSTSFMSIGKTSSPWTGRGEYSDLGSQVEGMETRQKQMLCTYRITLRILNTKRGAQLRNAHHDKRPRNLETHGGIGLTDPNYRCNAPHIAWARDIWNGVGCFLASQASSQLLLSLTVSGLPLAKGKLKAIRNDRSIRRGLQSSGSEDTAPEIIMHTRR